MAGAARQLARAWQAFWFDEGCEIGANRVLFRTLFYAVVATDVYLYSVDPRFGEQEGFALAKLPAVYALLFGGPLHSNSLVWIWEVCCFFCLCCSFGVFPELCGPCAALLYSIAYWGTQLDGFQHHYLLSLMLWIVAFSDVDHVRRRHWPYRLLAVQVALVYAFAVLTKLTGGPAFMTGSYAPAFSMLHWVHDAVSDISHVLGVTESVVWRGMALSVMLSEFYLAAALPFALCARSALSMTVAVVGIALHALFQFAGTLRMRLFSVYMIVFYLLFLPDLGEWIRRMGRSKGTVISMMIVGACRHVQRILWAQRE